MTDEEAFARMLWLVCRRCGNRREVEPDAAIYDDLNGEWFGVCDAPGRCECGATEWKYDRETKGTIR